MTFNCSFGLFEKEAVGWNGMLIGSDYDGFTVLIKRIEGMEKFFLCGTLTYNKLNIINKKYIHIAVFFTHFDQRSIISVTDGIDHFIGKVFRSNIQHI